ncbi:TRAP transporter small permease [Pelagibacterium halotolerans]|uniref:TRAP transporter small permease protein n=1 Tax=Pelagibacterium halotolerans (strain DSM 22347 / JCM 15775 / CGMCC 1.7692 / B2) TaxID=1082931 RepID=G4RC58_PELHB|nr:TRAP transporter small permease [Pelagibacterium halotolerans]AEQ52681.1 TRAP-type C4-dicarboxylate transport system, small permease component [Pelagibacterium halotolerans B2]QJR17616.1 TRAP transporter small permease [Pelagibacterium halotolerans]SEA84345.1 TRAP-type C4-dicarboxylate transport system, small permease component [Pelagibacterium halotolerans]
MAKVLTIICDWLARLLVMLVVVMTLVMLLSLGLQVVLRYAFSVTLPWPDEVALAMFSWSVLLIAPLGIREGFHARLVIVAESLPPRWQIIQQRCVNALCIVLGGVLFWAGGRYTFEAGGLRSAAIGYPLVWLYAALPVSGVLIMIFGAERVIRVDQPETVVKTDV